MKIMLVRDRNVLNTNWLAYLANLLHKRGHEVVIACDTYTKLGVSAPGYELEDGVRVANVNGKTASPLCNLWHKVRCKLLPSWGLFNRLIEKEKPDVIICYFPVDLYNVTRFQRHNIPIVQMVHNYPPVILDKVLKKNPLLRAWCRRSFAQVSAFQVLMNSYKKDIDPFFAPKKIVRIANPVKQYAESEMVDLAHEKKRIIYVARVEKNIKRPHLLAEAFAKIAPEFPDWKVEIWGLRKYPDYEKEIENFIAAHNLTGQVALMGYNRDVEALYRSADIHAFPSSCEGFSLAIADAMALGLPHIGFKDAHSVNEIIVDGHNGFLAEDVDDFAEKLKILMKDKALRIKFSQNAREDMKAYAPEILMQQWDDLFKELAAPQK